ncbi:uncharacterized protein PADG_11078 [Paracoccidioides brasiliensis Pb18]|uniref:Chromosome segregation in meiosis protein 3 domain-containing protein n=1 Tax=Paracoccidioides brasiliensis (strain Pb18) TaxID=502780 RepID=A0A0A0HW53_PARBD|nr:uncharacterized protein PADG_11078 [Paracoccidioides brasiliensis Pb18]KGM92628.1 hypothetical protein PADG_11078 [Paracoccidioides brasiliensis Pb18]
MRLLNFYQLWLDNLYPRAKFADGLAIIEKLGHSKRIQIMRKEWINEGKPKSHANERDIDEEIGNHASQPPAANDVTMTNYEDARNGRNSELFPTNTNTNATRQDDQDHCKGDDMLDNQVSSILGTGTKIPGHMFSNFGKEGSLFVGGDRDNEVDKPTPNVENGPEYDELEALLAETEGGGMPAADPKSSSGSGSGSGPPQGAFDDLDAMDNYDF